MTELVQTQVPQIDGNEVFTDAGLLLGTPVLTLDGALPVEFIAPGDRIVTRNGMRKVMSVEVTRVENARVVCFASDSLGVGRPAAAVMVSPNQQIVIRDWRAKVLYNQAEAAPPASRLCDGEFIRGDILPEARFITLRFAGPEVIYAGGLEMLCIPATVTA